MRELTFTEAAREALSEQMAKDPTIFVVGEGIGARGGNFNTTLGLYDQYGAMRLRDTPIVERGFVGMCTGAAMTGARPVVDFMFADFILEVTYPPNPIRSLDNSLTASQQASWQLTSASLVVAWYQL